MNLRIRRAHVEAMVQEFPHLASLREQLRFGDVAELSFQQLSYSELGFLATLYQAAGPELHAQSAILFALQKSRQGNDLRFGPDDDLELLLPALAGLLIEDAIRGWLFSINVDGKALAYVVTRLDFVAPGNDETGKIVVELKANAKGVIASPTIRISAGDMANRSVREILAAKGFLKETPELIAAYDAEVSRYFEWRGHYGAQYSALGVGFYAEDPSATHRDTDWSRKDVIILSAGEGRARLVNDEGILTARVTALEVTGDILGPYLRKAAKSNRYSAEEEMGQFQSVIENGLFTKIPVHPYLFMFHLELHHYLWVHVSDIAPYAYQPTLKQKLILPAEQTDLIDILTGEMDVLMDDIITGKSGGTTVLCAGPAGVGKTLTAEVYSEIIQRPLYRVHSGQLGLNVASMETALKEILTRAQRWGAVMLIDEADVYIKRRDDNMTMNAVVGVFLRVLEYFNGLLFLTTNRVDDIDEAIISRCIALIKYNPPDDNGRRQIWQVMCDQFCLDISMSAIDELVDIFPAATGRDIKGLAKLVAKFCKQKQVLPTVEVFKRCSVFRGLEPVAV
ncbi:AAA family ATPase [Acidithiobacillus ferridurans]|uniref:AAA family ATPase n=1 Tax=Acidithiobacillus ferridurans TaxID=1232575 RepID=UPI00195C5786|nr:ATP-binding protein [Acidithiobacillus ferridurans]